MIGEDGYGAVVMDVALFIYIQWFTGRVFYSTCMSSAAMRGRTFDQSGKYGTTELSCIHRKLGDLSSWRCANGVHGMPLGPSRYSVVSSLHIPVSDKLASPGV